MLCTSALHVIFRRLPVRNDDLLLFFAEEVALADIHTIVTGRRVADPVLLRFSALCFRFRHCDFLSFIQNIYSGFRLNLSACGQVAKWETYP